LPKGKFDVAEHNKWGYAAKRPRVPRKFTTDPAQKGKTGDAPS
jgi:hypothetical protein